MCLTTVDEKTKQVTEGWKIFFRNRYYFWEDKLESPFFGDISETGEWINDESKGNVYSHHYPKGFHFYINKKDAEKKLHSWGTFYYTMKKIKVKNMVASGKERCATYDYEVGVARSIFIEED